MEKFNLSDLHKKNNEAEDKIASGKKETLSNRIKNKTASFFSALLAFIGLGILPLIAAYILGHFLGIGLIILVIFFYIFRFIGIKIAGWYLKKEKKNHRIMRYFIFSNFILWVVPFLGIPIGFMSLKFSNYFSEKSKKFRIISIIGIVMSVLNSIAGAFLSIHL